jgi:hypothetical protein
MNIHVYNPTVSSWLALARLEAKLGNVVRAREVFEQSTLRCPNNVHILHAWGHMEQVNDLYLHMYHNNLKLYLQSMMKRIDLSWDEIEQMECYREEE